MSSVHLLKNHPTTGATTSSQTTTTTLTTTTTATVLAAAPPLPSGIKGESYPQASYQEVVENADVFMETLKALHGSLGTKFMVPTLGGRNLDLHLLFVEVTSRGGLEKVIRNRQWKEIIAVFNFPATITNASFVLRKYYISLLHHYEQIYYFRPENQPIMTSMVNGPVTPLGESSGLEIQAVMSPAPENGTTANDLPANSEVWTGRWVTGTIDGKFDCGYLVTVSIGAEKLQGVLYHVPEDPQISSNTNASLVPRRRRRRSRRSAADPNRPKPNRSGYNFFFSEHYARLKSSHGLLSKPSNGHEKTISTTIGNLWSELTEAEKQVYRDRGLRDKERYRRELLEYKKTSNGSKSQ